MSGIYIHIPFCKQACHYCDFHFSTSLKKKRELVDALCKELVLRKNEILGRVETIYFGGGTPSLLSQEELEIIFKTIYENYTIIENPEITLEANPDDLSRQKLEQLAKSPINRLSIGIQSFFEEDLKFMNRAHNAEEAENSIKKAKKYFKNISIDLIYGVPGMSNVRWKQNIEKALSFEILHISSYALTVEPKTALDTFIKKGLVPPVDDALAEQHFFTLMETLQTNDFVQYELSNFGKEGFFSRNNTAYWQGKTYLGIGPSAHSYDGKNRSWNVKNNSLYINSIEKGNLPSETETLSITDCYNEYVMTGLRTIWGVSLTRVELDFGKKYKEYLLLQAQKHLEENLLYLDGDLLLVTKKGKFLSDGLASDLFLLNL
ncbi:MAG: coproporphyrinogen III oxidase [Flavobacteriaceae bacterium CG_4_8_14_3_um_filter_34_10]|nr:radical SAM family heme chaperone HemW [Flavobacteriia bacterium]OIP50925.1 MAG: coproporphyrinogen III oxidase [Flavobacteriaceae bacterium CG2_30_34_30]PIV48937.1 MAG: coproporphyrinogen III oxidase [Flavobacteriaceae bacterium CG02_land_8_20_14_3_00_34_13]PIX08707.1 MAG: coproporphyrinogen III oxidase [Flavobacteriaceae bacterium CG_4_8_14_3_um_filter_34_10]PIZ08297.1 MAG: coproporphyrinogen III oxidase [Flavobacteriaceae bacterium CG_4_10_14_0_8_um_filter_34_31]PJC08503.1 MAG: coproporp